MSIHAETVTGKEIEIFISLILRHPATALSHQHKHGQSRLVRKLFCVSMQIRCKILNTLMFINMAEMLV